MTNTDSLDRIREQVFHAGRVTVLTRSGISAESGVPTFRGEHGLWRNFRAEDLANPQAFRKDPRLVWEWYDWRRGLVARTRPNAGHLALVELENRVPGFTLITQNVDGLHDRAGSRRPLKLHGDIWEVRCTRCDYRGTDRRNPLTELPPHCHCGSLLRPDIVWFGEMLPASVLQQAWQAARSASIFLVVGTSGLVQPAASLPILAKQSGAVLVEVNPEDTPLSGYADFRLKGTAGAMLTALLGASGKPAAPR